jgi:hypothetical protein
MSKTARQIEYANLMNMPAWKDIEKWANEEAERSMRMMDAISAKDLSVNHVCEERGLRKGIFKVIRYVKDQAEGR